MSSFYDLTAKTLDGTEVRLFYTVDLLVSLCWTVVGVYNHTTERGNAQKGLLAHLAALFLLFLVFEFFSFGPHSVLERIWVKGSNLSQ